MSRELLSNLGYHIIKEEHDLDPNSKSNTEVKMCIEFKSKKFLEPEYAPKGIKFVECEIEGKHCKKLVPNLEQKVKVANNDKSYLKRLNGKNVSGGIILVNDKGSEIKQEIIDAGLKANFYFWDIHRIFFYCMKVFSHSILENWVSESTLGIVLTEQENAIQFEQSDFFTTNMVAIRYSEKSKAIEVYFTYFVDCLKDPHKISAHDDALHTKNVEDILDDVYSRMEDLTQRFYPDKEKTVTVEIHSLSGFTDDAEFKVKIYSKHYKNWKKLNMKEPIIDEHTLFKYAIIPWEAVMDYAFTKKTGMHTKNKSELNKVVIEIEEKFAGEFEKAVKEQQILDPFTSSPFITKKNKSFAGYETIYHANVVTRSPIKQRMMFFSRTKLNEKVSRLEEIKNIIADIQTDSMYNYNWIGIMSGSGFEHEVIDYIKTFKKEGIGIGLIDAVTKQLIVAKDTNEGGKLNQMFLSECIS